ncbi:MAG: DUF99 family protein, partial [Candidatus Aenigmarchaeota archaeon]|nr:DUF99 family protein [Candidatus Aenigmarchaeota archaeon]
REIRIIGWDDTPFTFKDRETTLIGVVCRGGVQIDGVIRTKIKVDGTDVTERLAKAVNESKHKEQLRLIMLDGITFGGFNIVDIERLHKKTKLPVIVIIRDSPNMQSIEKSLSKFKDSETRWGLIEKAGKVKKFEVKNKVLKGRKTIYYQNKGIDDYTCEKIINLTAIHSVTPEPVRIAHLIASGFK